MNRVESKEIKNKTMKTIVSCTTKEQLLIACKYAQLAYKKISIEGNYNLIRLVVEIERATGYMLGKFKYKE